MNWRKWADWIFPYIEPLTDAEKRAQDASLTADVNAINSARFSTDEQRALDESQRIAAAEIERVRTSESKATTYLAVLAALVPLVITLQGATWENKSGPAPQWLKLATLAAATVYVAAAGYHAFRALRVTGFQRIGEREVTSAWQSPRPLQKLARSTLLASRRSRNTVNLKVTYIKVTHEHMLRAFGAFVLLLLLDPAFYAMGFRNQTLKDNASRTVVTTSDKASREGSMTLDPNPTFNPKIPKKQADRQPGSPIPPALPATNAEARSSPISAKSDRAIQ